MTGGRFPEDNTALPKAPVPIISVYFPLRTLEEFRQNSLEFMQNMANPEIGGFFTVVQGGQGARGANIVKVVRTRFSKMNLVKWRVSCIAPTITQTGFAVRDTSQTLAPARFPSSIAARR